MSTNLTRRDFLKTAAASFFAVNASGVLPSEKVFASSDCKVNFVDENGVKTWLGVPYAKPPVKNLRWRAPEPLKPSDKTLDAKKYRTLN